MARRPARSTRGRSASSCRSADWFRGDFNDFAREAWHDSGAAASGYLQPSAGVEQLFDEHRAGLADHGRILYAIAMFSCWWQQTRQDAPPAAATSR